MYGLPNLPRAINGLHRKRCPQIDAVVGRGTKILINLGVNDVANVNAYAELVNKKTAEWTQKGATVYYASVNPVENGQYITKSMVNTF